MFFSVFSCKFLVDKTSFLDVPLDAQYGGIILRGETLFPTHNN